jgi:hypothetical protein
MCRPINKFTNALDLGENRISRGSPREWSLMFIVMFPIVFDFEHQFADVAERAAANGLASDEREPALDLIEPA